MKTSTKPQMPRPVTSNKAKGNTPSYFSNNTKKQPFMMKKSKKG